MQGRCWCPRGCSRAMGLRDWRKHACCPLRVRLRCPPGEGLRDKVPDLRPHTRLSLFGDWCKAASWGGQGGGREGNGRDCTCPPSSPPLCTSTAPGPGAAQHSCLHGAAVHSPPQVTVSCETPRAMIPAGDAANQLDCSESCVLGRMGMAPCSQGPHSPICQDQTHSGFISSKGRCPEVPGPRVALVRAHRPF